MVRRPLCSRCDSGIRATVCPCRRNVQRTGYQGVPQPQLVQAPAPAPVTTARNVRLNGQQAVINGTLFGSAVAPHQVLNIITPAGHVIEVLCAYDGGSDSSFVDTSLLNCAIETSDINYSMRELTRSKSVSGKKAAFMVQSLTGPVRIEALSTNMDKCATQSKTLTIPPEWCSEFQLHQNQFTPHGVCLMVLGCDNREFFPLEIR